MWVYKEFGKTKADAENIATVERGWGAWLEMCDEQPTQQGAFAFVAHWELIRSVGEILDRPRPTFPAYMEEVTSSYTGDVTCEEHLQTFMDTYYDNPRPFVY